MRLFPREASREDDELVTGSDAATRALSVTAVERDFVEGVYEKLASVYDVMFGPALQAGRVRAIEQMAIAPGDAVLEVGVGTGSTLSLYPRHGRIVGIDLSSPMLEKARERVLRERMSHVRLLQMDAADLRFAERSFDVVYAPYLISVVPDPVQVAREMRRVCRPGGRIVFLNHFLSVNPLMSRLERLLSPLTIHVGFRADLDLTAFLAQTELEPTSIEKVNVPRIWSLVTCIEGV